MKKENLSRYDSEVWSDNSKNCEQCKDCIFTTIEEYQKCTCEIYTDMYDDPKPNDVIFKGIPCKYYQRCEYSPRMRGWIRHQRRISGGVWVFHAHAGMNLKRWSSWGLIQKLRLYLVCWWHFPSHFFGRAYLELASHSFVLWFSVQNTSYKQHFFLPHSFLSF